MTQDANNNTVRTTPDAAGPNPPLPHAVVKKMRWPFPIIWIVPVVAAALAGYFLYQRHQERGAEITIQFDEVAGVKPGDTVVAVRGVSVGRVHAMELSADHQHVLVHVRLTLADSSIARHDTLFWLVRPEISLENVSALSTVVSGPYIEAKPGGGAPATSFNGLEQAPLATTPGIKIILRAERVGQLNSDSPVTYRGIQVGVVEGVRLADEADAAEVTVHVWERYKDLVRTNSQFWMVKGADVQGSLFSGIKLQLNSLRSLVSGGVAFATPEKNPGNLVAPGAQFFLSEQAKEDWLKWKPKIAIPPEGAAPHPQSPNAQPQKNVLPSLKQE